MKKLIDLPDNTVFYRGTIIIMKDFEITPKGNFDKMYCMISSSFDGSKFDMLDLYRSIGSCVWLSLLPNVEGHFGVNKQGIIDWVESYIKTFYIPEVHKKYIKDIPNMLYIDDLSSHFIQANRDLFMK